MSRHAEPLREPEVRSGHEARLGEVAGAVCVQADRCLPRPGPAASPWPATGPGGARLLSLPLPRPFDLPWRGKHAGKGRKRPGSGEEGTSKTPDPSWLLLAT